MANKDNVNVEIRARNLTKEAFAKVSEALKALEAQSDQTSGKGKTNWAAWFATISGGVAVGNLVASAFKTAGALIAQVPLQLMEIAKRGGDVADVRSAFTGLAGGAEQAASTLKSLRSSFGHTINDFELMKSANDVLRRGVRLTAQDFGVTAQAARILGDQVGGDAKANFDSLLSAIGRGNERELKQLGLNMANVEREIKRTATSLGVEVNALTESQKQLALKNAVLAESNRLLKENGPVQNDVNDNIAAGATLIQNWKDRLGEAIATSPQLNIALTRITSAMVAAFGEDQQAQVQSLSRLIGQLVIVALGATSWIVSGAQKIASAYYQARAAVDTVFQAFNDRELRETERAINTIKKLYGDAIPNHAKQRLDTLQARLDYLKGYSQGLETDANEALATNQKLKQMAADAQTWLAKVTAEVAAAGDAAAGADPNVRGFGDGVGAAGENAGAAAKLVEELQKRIRDMSASIDLAKKQGSLEAWAKANGDALYKLTLDAAAAGQKIPQNLIDGFIKVSNARTSDIVAAEIERFIENTAKRAERAWERTATGFIKNEESLTQALLEADRERRRITTSSIEFELSEIRLQGEQKIAELDRWSSNYGTTVEAIRALTAEKMRQAREVHNAEIRKMRDEADTWGNRFKSLIGAVPQLLKSALTGGGGFKGFGQALTAQIGESLIGKGATNLMNKGLQGLINKGFSKGIASQLATFIPGIGGMIGSLAGPLLNKVTGWIGGLFSNKERKENEAATKQVKDLSAELVKTYGSMENLRLLGKLTGIDIAAGFGHAGKKGLAQFQADVESFKKKLAEISPKFNAELQKVLAGAEGLGFRLPETVEAYLRKLREAGVISEENARLLESFGESSTIDFKKMEEAAARYGIKVDALGRGFQQFKFTEAVTQILEDYDLLKRGGADIQGVLAGMADEVSEIAQRSMRLGISMPENMREIAAALIANGQLLDENGDKITDINTLSFGDPIKVGLERIGALLESLVKGFGFELPKAMAQVPSDIDVSVNVVERRSRIYDGDTGGVWTETGGPSEFDVPGSDAGGLFTRPTFRVFAERQPEVAGSPNAIVDAFAAALKKNGGMGGAGVTVNLYAMDADSVRRWMRGSGKDEIKHLFLTNPDGFTTEIKEHLGING